MMRKIHVRRRVEERIFRNRKVKIVVFDVLEIGDGYYDLWQIFDVTEEYNEIYDGH